MPLKPSDIEQKTFSTALRGYDLNEVDDFLDEIIATIRDLEEQVAAKGSKTAPAAAAPAVPAVDESAVGRALIAAQNAADKMIAEAEAEAERIKEEAKGEAENWINERDQKKADAEQQIGELRLRVDNVRREIGVLATVVADGLDEMDTSIRAAEASVAATGSSMDEDESVGLSSPDYLGGVEETEDEEPRSDQVADEDISTEPEGVEDDVDETGERGDHELAVDGEISVELDDTAVEETINSD
jgi:cell division initiation protein